jgi:hypothetical protein
MILASNERGIKKYEEEFIMRKIIIAIALIAATQGMALGQTRGERKGWVYGFAGVGARSNDSSNALVSAGGGGEGYFGTGVGIGGEIGYIGRTGNAGNGFAIASVNTSYHFLRDQRVIPFVTGGASVGFAGGGAGGGNFGGGVNYWMSNKLGLRFEVRDHIFSSDSPHTVIFRVGLSFR